MQPQSVRLQMKRGAPLISERPGANRGLISFATRRPENGAPRHGALQNRRSAGRAQQRYRLCRRSLMHGDDQSIGRLFARTYIRVRCTRVEIHGIAGTERAVVLAMMQFKFAVEDIEELIARMHVS